MGGGSRPDGWGVRNHGLRDIPTHPRPLLLTYLTFRLLSRNRGKGRDRSEGGGRNTGERGSRSTTVLLGSQGFVPAHPGMVDLVKNNRGVVEGFECVSVVDSSTYER